jgi:hypothetical protein
MVGTPPCAIAEARTVKFTPLWPCLLLLAACGGDAEVAVTPAWSGAFEPDLVVNDDRVAVVWHDNRNGIDQLYARLYDTHLRPIGNELPLTDSSLSAYEASAAFMDQNLAVAWYEAAHNGAAQVHLGLWNPQGELLWHRMLTPVEGRSRIPVLRAQGARLFIAWVEDADLTPATPPRPSLLRYEWLDTEGNSLSQGATLAQASPTTWNLNAAALDADTLAVTYDASYATTAPELYLSLITPSGNTTRRVSADDGIPSLYPDLAPHDAVLALTWFDEVNGQSDVKLHLFSRAQLANAADLDLTHEARAVTDTPGASTGAYLAWSAATLGLAWNDDSVGQAEVYFQSFDLSGKPRGPARRLTHTRTASLIPAIEGVEGDFLLSWSEVTLNGHDTTQATVMLRRVSP